MMISKIINATCLFIATCSVGYVIYTSTHKPLTIDDSVKNQVVSEAKIISKKIDKNGLEHTIIEETNNVLPRNLITSDTGYDKGFVDSLLAETGIQRKEIISLMKVNQTITGRNLQAVAVIDSLYKKFEYSDNNLYVSYTPTSDSTKAGVFNYKYNQDLKFAQFNRKKWFLGDDHIYTDISTNDTNSTINGVSKLSVLQPVKDFGIKVTAKSILLPQSGHIGVGGQLRVRYKRVTATGSNLYFPEAKKWLPVFGVEYDFLSY
jgi:hypothetical protein